MKAKVAILFRQIEGAGDDTEADNPDGVFVSLTRWMEKNDYRAPNHYLLQKRVMVDREIVVDSFKAFPSNARFDPDPEFIRMAIKEFDDAVRDHPSFGQGQGQL